ncbi:MAG TPA: FxLYD domain-containing protein [Thermoanaerobaculia bacterium]|jgi:hypothetical protein
MKTKPAPRVLALLLIAASPAAADWLVTRAGGRVETRGPWQVKGRLVVFTQTDGALSSLRLADVDLEASRKATAETKAQTVKPPALESPKKKLAVLTDKDFRKPPAASSSEVKSLEEVQPAAPSGPVAVSSWERSDRPGGDGVEILGTLHNNTDSVVVSAAVEVQLFNEVEEQVGTASAILSTSVIQPRGTVDFRATFPGVFAFADVKFDANGLPLARSSASPDQR